MINNQKTVLSTRDMILACMAAAGGSSYEPVHIQKLVFIFQEKVGDFLETKPFTFRPYHYGPYDPAIYATLGQLSNDGIVSIDGGPFDKWHSYSLVPERTTEAQEALDSLPEYLRNYLVDLSKWVRSQGFANLVGAVYKEFPAMRANSIFR